MRSRFSGSEQGGETGGMSPLFVASVPLASRAPVWLNMGDFGFEKKRRPFNRHARAKALVNANRKSTETQTRHIVLDPVEMTSNPRSASQRFVYPTRNNGKSQARLATLLHIRSYEVDSWIRKGWLKARLIQIGRVRLTVIEPGDFLPFYLEFCEIVVGNRLDLEKA